MALSTSGSKASHGLIHSESTCETPEPQPEVESQWIGACNHSSAVSRSRLESISLQRRISGARSTWIFGFHGSERYAARIGSRRRFNIDSHRLKSLGRADDEVQQNLINDSNRLDAGSQPPSVLYRCQPVSYF
jgi:hypothetical protein